MTILNLWKYDYINTKVNYFDSAIIQMKIDGNGLKQKKATLTHKKVLNIYIVYQIKLWSFTFAQKFTPRYSSFEAVKCLS